MPHFVRHDNLESLILSAGKNPSTRASGVGKEFEIASPSFFSLASLYHKWYTGTPVKKPNRPEWVPRLGAQYPNKPGKKVPAIFFRTEAGREPVRDWLKALPYPNDRKRIGEDIKTVEFAWPIGMPVCRPLGQGIYEVRSDLIHNRIARVLFYIDRKSGMVLLHGFIKKTQKTPDKDLALARRNKERHERGLQ